MVRQAMLDRLPPTAPHAPTPLMPTLVAGAVASLFGQTFGVPLDCVSQRLMIQGFVTGSHSGTAQPAAARYYRGGWECASELYRTEGIRRGFYRGFAASLCANVPYSAVWWSVYCNSKFVCSTLFSSRVFCHLLRVLPAVCSTCTELWASSRIPSARLTRPPPTSHRRKPPFK